MFSVTVYIGKITIVKTVKCTHLFLLHSTEQKASVPRTSRMTATRSCQYRLTKGEYQKAIEAAKDCMNLKMAKAELEFSLNVPPRMEKI